MFGKSIGAKAPALFVELLRHKAENAGGSVMEFNTNTTRLSQTCICGTIKKKSLKDRVHNCECGVTQQRDLFSAYLAIYIKEDNELDLKAATRSYQGIERCLLSAIQTTKNLSTAHRATLALSKSELESLADIKSPKKLKVS